MYVPPHFEETRLEVLHRLIRAHPLATLATLSSGGIDANHIPLHLSEEPGRFGALRGHVARSKRSPSSMKARSARRGRSRAFPATSPCV
jgi:predicted FMN-binding regulatory protein PaiB